ncbi:oligomeric golgi complex component, COG2-domain-containing protein [Glomus cerebriforme]|uniref:Conserved oligomeric Golgi complex subunit 2 n=1 Tax=Glomus cerebriforme TaxID=658196 RepID=A0A397SQ16_9GLOM|nr:oligomeric golgi complex component, COG2-domain-containing protein [Glomus cerebriforme]
MVIPESTTSSKTEEKSAIRTSRSPILTIYTTPEHSDQKTWPNFTSPTDNTKTPLPFPQPLNREMFATPEFNADNFLASRRHLPLNELKKELIVHLKSLKSELVEMINKDYSSFVDLSTNLKGVDKVIEEVARPLGKMREEVEGVRLTFQGVVDSLENQLVHRTSIREKKASLQLLINIHESVRKVENLLLISSDTSSSLVSKDDSGNNAKQIERVAIEYNQMQYLVNKGKDLPFVENIDWRIIRIKDTLRTNLSSALRSALRIVKGQSSTSSSKETLTQILRTYALIDQTISAEEVIREELVAPFIQETVKRSVLENPQSIAPSAVIASRLFAGKSMKSRIMESYSKEPLALMYNKILQFINNDCNILLEITRKVLRGTSFEILVNSIWTEVVEVVNKKLSLIFNPGIPNMFHKNYSISMNFVSSIESLCYSKKSLLYLRNHSTYVEFMKRWQLPVYFQLRFKEISNQIEETLNTGLDVSIDSSNDTQYPTSLKLPASKFIILAIERCWSEEVFIYGLSHRFWKLTLQLIERYKKWLVSILVELVETNNQANDKIMNSPALRPSSGSGNRGSGSPVPSSSNNDALDEQVLRHLVIVSHDVENMTIKIKEIYRESIIIKLPESMIDQPIIEESILNSLSSLQSDLPDLSQRISAILTKRCTEALRHVRSIITQYRQPNTKPPTESSYFVPHIMKPLAAFYDVNKPYLSDKRRKEWSSIVGDTVSVRYYTILYEYLTNLKKTEESSKIMKMKRLKKGQTRGGLVSSLFSDSGDNGLIEDSTVMSDEDKIRLQYLLDVKKFGKELTNIGIDIKGLKGYIDLYKVVEPYESIRKS